MASPATEAGPRQFRRLMLVVLASGVLAGMALFAVQQFTIVPLIQTAEAYEAAAHPSGATQHGEEWAPADGWERTSFTAIATLLSSIGFAALLFGSLAFIGTPVNAARGALWGLAGFACFHLAPALGLPPEPPGVPVADVHARQLWWVGAALATGIGLWLLLGRGRNWLVRGTGFACLALPHLVGAPQAIGESLVPAELMRRFMIASLATMGIFWVLLGSLGGLIYGYAEARAKRAITGSAY